uniref:Reverse transcriptase Ty1/copia-type domain-containing protein n=1 Tax=Solanum lycopersicum TaxID=4081 RepID=A0A3Q7HB94_SOLLC
MPQMLWKEGTHEYSSNLADHGWIIDTCATHHFNPLKEILSSLKGLQGDCKIQVPTGECPIHVRATQEVEAPVPVGIEPAEDNEVVHGDWHHEDQIDLPFVIPGRPPRNCGDDIVVLMIYVDDILLIGSSHILINDAKQYLYNQFKVKDLGS